MHFDVSETVYNFFLVIVSVLDSKITWNRHVTIGETLEEISGGLVAAPGKSLGRLT